MTGESSDSSGRRWLVEPPGPQEVKFQLAAGDQIEITPEVRQAFDHLVDALAEAEVEGYADDCVGYKKGCTQNSFDCFPRRKCTVEWQFPSCFVDYHCTIAQIG